MDDAGQKRLILASASPRRQKLLRDAKLDFEVIPSGVEETRNQGEGAREYAVRAASDKALAVSARYPKAIVIGADTVVECDGVILEKPRDAADARRMLTTLSGRTHIVVTAYVLARSGAILEAAPVLSRVTFREITPEEIESYIASGEPLDKAGAYGVQGLGGSFVTAVDGSRDNVMGLPVAELLEALSRQSVR